MKYEEIYKPLSRTSFASKMERAFCASIETMSANGQVEPSVLRTKYLPEEIEAFVLNSVVTKEYNNRAMTDRQFVDVMNAIRNFQPPEYYEKLKTNRLKWILPTIGAVQFELQQYAIFRLYRHHCLFTFANKNVNMYEEFRKKFERSFDEYAAIVYTFHILLANKELGVFKEYWEGIALKNQWFFRQLKMTREQYEEELTQFATSPSDYKYCLRPSYSYPFIENNSTIYLPTPHLLIHSITTSFMNRLTFGNIALREKIGKTPVKSIFSTLC